MAVLDNVLEHLDDQHDALERIASCLRPGGVAYILVPNRWWPIEAHYSLPFLAWLPLPLATRYLRWSGRGSDYTDASYAPSYLRMRRLLAQHRPRRAVHRARRREPRRGRRIPAVLARGGCAAPVPAAVGDLEGVPRRRREEEAELTVARRLLAAADLVVGPVVAVGVVAVGLLVADRITVPAGSNVGLALTATGGALVAAVLAAAAWARSPLVAAPLAWVGLAALPTVPLTLFLANTRTTCSASVATSSSGSRS